MKLEQKILAAQKTIAHETLKASAYLDSLYFEQNGIVITINPAFQYGSDESPFMAHTPDIERYFLTLKDARRWLRDKRRMRKIWRKHKQAQKEIGF